MKIPLALFASISLLSLSSPVFAETITIISDNFTDTDGKTLGPGAGGSTANEHNPYTPPNVDLPGNPYTYNDSSIISPITVQGNKASISGEAGQSAAINITSSATPGYVKPTTLTISADLTLNTLTFNGDSYNQEGLGFYSAPQPDQTFHAFLGLALNYNGALSLLGYSNTDNSPYVDDSVAYTLNGGVFDPLISHKVTYTVDTTSGEITSATLTDINGTQTYTFAPGGFDFTTEGFTPTQTTYAGFWARSGVADTTAYLDNFSVTGFLATPEPNTLALLATGLAGLAFLAQRRRNFFAPRT